MKTKAVTFHDTTYQFPEDHIDVAAMPPDDSLYVRLAPPNSIFHLILDEWADRPSPHGPDVPRISRLSDNRFGKFSVIRSEVGPIVCSLGPQPHFNCGMQVSDGPVKWSVLFDKKYVDQASNIKAEVSSLLRSYRGQV